MAVYFGNPNGIEDIHQILGLQRVNLPTSISNEELEDQGFVTVRHTVELLSDMNAAEPQIIAKDGDQVVGYALVMLPAFAERVPVLVPMFELLDSLSFKDRILADCNYYVIGQVCVAKSHRGQGVFDGLYVQHHKQMSGRYDFVITEIATRNRRSLRAHARVGFKTIHQFTAPDGEAWDIVLWDWS
ncbi:GNAT family N-acetyltransferase [Flavilitoribacter nigricans]|uniref:GNAT family N-acetyltransferase n=1 Tax=Flavilitoribacter nigricans (strain ATCC 23147 / DSM 23189 / NBRC 102662 / NCIMB 1420 / SS-2) TaxID=1122177 RepID=A0A2D0N8C3_FLAN2|nr:GNAT family N-acetyltransferase [Flavilitoribacter nigricans]PHN04761.1 GNAT family N-acetyltransferase [Flavilitoribacter nigricans DSM 23189 = NBRC 102662]